MSPRALSKTISKVGTPALSRPLLRARLQVVYPARLAGSTNVGTDELVVGRQQDGMFFVDEATVSRRHLSIAWEPKRGAHVASDLGSRNGSSVDGVRLSGEPRPLEDNSVVRIGDVLLVYEREPAAGTDLAPHVSRDEIPGSAATMRALRASVQRTATDAAPVLIIGETGTGKERIAREIHRLSKRPGRLVAVNCAALAPTLVESQLFGHVKGAFTGATEAQPGLFRAAQGGTLFLDEVGELPIDLQPKLLRTIQEGEVHPVGAVSSVRVDVRVIAATNRDLARAADEDRFRADLYSRLSLWELRVPPLRARRGDLFEWIDRLHKAWLAEGAQMTLPSFEPDAAEAILLAPWPLNLRGLDRLIRELGVAPAAHRPICREDLPAWIDSVPGAKAKPEATLEATAPPVPTRQQFEAAFAELRGSVRALARHFRRDRRQIYRWIEAYGLRNQSGD